MSNDEKITPYQFKKRMTYVKNTPDFLKNLIPATNQPNIETKFQLNEDEEGSDHDELLGSYEERPQIVVLKEGEHLDEEDIKKHYIEQGKIKPEVKKDIDKEKEFEKTAAVDENGRILFRSKKRKSDEDKEDCIKTQTDRKAKESKKKLKKKKPKVPSLLSFEEE